MANLEDLLSRAERTLRDADLLQDTRGSNVQTIESIVAAGQQMILAIRLQQTQIERLEVELERALRAPRAAQPMKPMKPVASDAPLTDAQHRAIAEWQHRMGEAAWWPHFIEAVFPERSNREAALRSSVRSLVKQGRVFRALLDGRVEMIPPTAPPVDDGVPF